MKSLWILAFAAMAALAQTPATKTVYVLPMSGGLDQYLAEWLTREHVMQVVADPKAADALLTDTLGQGFDERLVKLHPTNDEEDDEPSAEGHPGFRSASSRGTIFLVDAKTRKVLWSHYEKAPRTHSAGNLNRSAERIVKKLNKSH